MTTHANAEPAPEPKAPAIDVAHVAHLARLWLTESETAELQRDMEELVAFAALLLSQAAEDSPPPAQFPVSEAVPLRGDALQAASPREDILANAPATLEHCILVPGALAKGDADA